jgi:hypothetical protein
MRSTEARVQLIVSAASGLTPLSRIASIRRSWQLMCVASLALARKSCAYARVRLALQAALNRSGLRRAAEAIGVEAIPRGEVAEKFDLARQRIELSEDALNGARMVIGAEHQARKP